MRMLLLLALFALSQNVTFVTWALYNYALNLIKWTNVSYLINNDQDYRTKYNITTIILEWINHFDVE
jgi:hypothetical protein